MLKSCPFRRFRGTYPECTITEEHGKLSTSLTSTSVCNECQIPEIIHQVNCSNLLFRKVHVKVERNTFDATMAIEVFEQDWQTNCKAIGFKNRDDYKTKCSRNCPALQPIHCDLSNEELISIVNFDAAKATDRELRQAVLVILYKYHTRHPERYRCFDVTPKFLAESLKISVADVVRVVSPMEDEGEVVTESYLAEPCFRYVRITSQGIKMIDEKPLFDSFDTAKLRFTGHLISMSNSQVGALNVGDNNQNQNQGDTMSEASKYDMRGSSFPGGFAETNYGKMVETQHNYAPEQKQTLAEAAEEIQQLLKQQEKTNPTATEAEKQAFVTAAIAPTRRERIVKALQAGGEKVLEEFLKNPYVNVAIAIIKTWQKAE